MNAKSRAVLLGGLLVSSLVLLGCLSDLADGGCSLLSGKDRDHCLQGAGATLGDDKLCGKIVGADFASGGSNPPKDKCYLMTANNTEKYAPCEKIKGGAFSYTVQECVQGVADKKLAEVKTDLSKPSVSPEDLADAQKKLADTQKYYEMLSSMQKSQQDMQQSAVRNLRG